MRFETRKQAEYYRKSHTPEYRRKLIVVRNPPYQPVDGPNAWTWQPGGWSVVQKG